MPQSRLPSRHARKPAIARRHRLRHRQIDSDSFQQADSKLIPLRRFILFTFAEICYPSRPPTHTITIHAAQHSIVPCNLQLVDIADLHDLQQDQQWFLN